MTTRSPLSTLVALVIAAGVVGLLALELADPWSAHRSTVAAWPLPPRGAPAPRLALGVTPDALADNAVHPWTAGDLEQVDRFEQDARHHADIVMWFADWRHSMNFDPKQADAVYARGSFPELAWEPWDSTKGINVPQPRYRLARIVAGAFDPYIRRWARELAAYGKPIKLRFAQEMNGTWFPWAERFNGNRPGEFVKAWRHVHAIFDAAGATNVQWVWCPVNGTIHRSQYPGDAQVDVLALAGFNGGTRVFLRVWRAFPESYGPALTTIHRLAPGKPVELSELSSAEVGGSKAQWIADLFAEVKRRPYVRSLVWFNVRKETDWRIESSRSAQRAFARGIAAISRSAG